MAEDGGFHTVSLVVVRGKGRGKGALRQDVILVQAHESALAMLDVRAPLEEKLAAEGASEEAVANTLLAYLRVEEATGDSARIVTLFERALVAIPSRLDIWSRYLNYSEENIKVCPLPAPSTFYQCIGEVVTTKMVMCCFMLSMYYALPPIY
jgi:hypothetical protein